jgi:hypothetical protein
MRLSTPLLGFTASFLVFVPVASRSLEADVPTDGALTRPDQQTMTVKGATITVALDRGLMKAGDEAKVTLIATADTARDVALDVTAMKDKGMGDERVPRPPVIVGRREVIVHAAPGGGAPTEVSFHLGHKDAPGQVAWFDVQVTPARAKKPTGRAWEDQDAGKAAIAGLATWTGNSFGLAIEPPATLPPAGPFVVGVRVTNTTRRPLEHVAVQLGSARHGGSWNELDGALEVGSDDAFTADVLGDADDAPLAPGATRVVSFTITPADGAHAFALMAEASADGAGALDVKAVETGTPTPSVAAK